MTSWFRFVSMELRLIDLGPPSTIDHEEVGRLVTRPGGHRSDANRRQRITEEGSKPIRSFKKEHLRELPETDVKQGIVWWDFLQMQGPPNFIPLRGH